MGRRTVAALVAGLVTLTGPLPSAAGSPPGGAAAVERFLAEHPGAERVDDRTVAWDGGAVLMVFPERPQGRAPSAEVEAEGKAEGEALTSASSVYGCESGWSCLYEHSGYGGRRLQFRDCGVTQSLGAYGFANQASSWVNNRPHPTTVGAYPGTTLWYEASYSRSSWVGSTDNDRADTIRLGC